ncbi:RsiW anti- sigma factor protease PrsW [Gottschalkia purinilytica]|uniref:Protease PrsW n=1 Tax=Gottschalkia purinilytica TaxID=1503 RepID=A0A0L0WAP3_GOTPU|nr:PrsW family glutamic-type intramembrane protease [Gottschalkia purinilytica]KNF08579.1 RsiW anti- sigma factor protease PrsW [Gottschalkia purinilytica]
MILRLFIIAIVPAISIALATYLSDKYEKEPISVLFNTFIFGALSVIPTLFVERSLSLLNIFPGLLGVLYVSFIVAGLTEEYFKRLVIMKYIYKNRNFNERLDGIIYCVFSALGFATIENIVYVVFRFSYNPYVGLYRGILSVPAHTIFAVTMGYYISLSKFCNDDRLKEKYLRKSLYMPAILHGIFDFILMSKIPIYGLLFIPYLIYLWKTNQNKLDKYMKESQILHEDTIIPESINDYIDDKDTKI